MKLINEKENIANKEVNQQFKDTFYSGNLATKKDLDKFKKMGYDVELDQEARKQFGRRYFGDNVTIRNPKTGREIHASVGNFWDSDDSVVARPIDPKQSDSKAWHTIKNRYNRSKTNNQITRDKFDYKNYLDKPFNSDTNKQSLSTVQQFKKDKEFLKDKEYEIKAIDDARSRLANVRSRLSTVRQESLEEDNKQLIESIQKLLETRTSPEDEEDNKILRDIIRRRLDRANAKISKDEQDLLNKYGIQAIGNHLYNKDFPYVTRAVIGDNARDNESRAKINKINYADRARKISDRIKRDTYKADDGTEFTINPGSHKFINYDKSKRSIEKDVMNRDVSVMKRALSSRKYHQKSLDNVDQDYIDSVEKAKAEYDKQIEDAKNQREWSRGYHQDYVNYANRDVQDILNRRASVKESLNESINSRDDIMKDIYNNFKTITGVEFNNIFSGDNELPFDQTIIDQTEPKIREYVKGKYNLTDNDVDDLYYDLDLFLASKREVKEDLKEDYEEKNWELVSELEDYDQLKQDTNTLFYEIDNCTRGWYTQADDYYGLAQCFYNLGVAMQDFSDEIESLASVNESIEDKAKEVVNPVMADAIRDQEKAKEVKDKVTQITKDGKSKLRLDESLFEDYDEEVPNDVILEIYDDETLSYPYYQDYQADGHFVELERMSVEELEQKGIIGYAQLYRNDEDKFVLQNIEYRTPSFEEKVDEAIKEYLDEVNLVD